VREHVGVNVLLKKGFYIWPQKNVIVLSAMFVFFIQLQIFRKFAINAAITFRKRKTHPPTALYQNACAMGGFRFATYLFSNA